MRDVDALARHWELLRESQLPAVKTRGKSRDAWCAAAAAYERSQQQAGAGAGDNTAMAPTPQLQQLHRG